MIGKQLLFTGVRACSVAPLKVPDELAVGQVLLEVEHSLISPGTELLSYRGFTGIEPFCPGYTAVGRVIRKGPGADDVPMDRPLFLFPTLKDMTGCHATHKLVSPGALWVPVPEGLDPARACYARMINVAVTPFCHLGPRCRGVALVVGLGLVGNIAAQLARLHGFEVIGLDPDAARRQRALDVGVAHVLDTATPDPVQAVKDRTGGQGVDLTINATGLASTFMMSVEATRAGGEVSTLGGARGHATINLADLLHKHVQGRQITIRGGWEVALPRESSIANQTPSTQENLVLAMRWLETGRVNIDGLWTHRIRPEQLPEAYAALDRADPGYQGVTVSWRS